MEMYDFDFNVKEGRINDLNINERKNKCQPQYLYQLPAGGPELSTELQDQSGRHDIIILSFTAAFIASSVTITTIPRPPSPHPPVEGTEASYEYCKLSVKPGEW